MNNTFGYVFTVTSFGESHGPAIGAVVDGVPAGIEIDPAFIQNEMNRRRPGQSRLTSARNEADQVEILSGVFNGRSTGTPIAMLIRNGDQHSADYENLADTFRPGHADWTFERKFGFRDHRGGGRASGRETTARVAAGAIAKLFLKKNGISVRACTVQIGNVHARKIDWDLVESNPVRTGDPDAAEAMSGAILDAAADRDSIGGVIYGEITGLPAGLGEPIFDKMDALLAHAMLSIGGVKGFEIGDGFSSASMHGSDMNDALLPGGRFATNHAGGVLGGISSGDTVTYRIAVKPTPSIASEQLSVDRDGHPVDLVVKGRHDPCLVPRIVPVAEAMAALVMADLLLRSRLSRI